MRFKLKALPKFVLIDFNSLVINCRAKPCARCDGNVCYTDAS